MDRASVAHLFGKCFAEALRERVEDNGGYADEQTVAARMSREYRIPAEFAERVTGYALSTGAVEITERADAGATVENAAGYESFTARNLSVAADRAEERGDYPVSYGSKDNRPATPAVLFPEATKDTVTAGEAEAAPAKSSSGRDDVDIWSKACRARRDENAAIIAASPAPRRTDYTADPLAQHREQIEAQTGDTARENTAKTEARLKWPETDRLINWLYYRPGQAQEVKSLYYERGAHSPEEQEKVRAALNQLREAGKIRHRRRNGHTIVRLKEGVKPRRYTRRELEMLERYTEHREADQEESEPEQSFDPQVMAEMAAAGASYSEVWDS